MMHLTEIMFTFPAGHRLPLHTGKCKGLHGHTYRVEVKISAPLNRQGMVADFGDVKRIVGDWIEEHLDHALILDASDPCVRAVQSFAKVYLMDGQPTAERIAALLFSVFAERLSVQGIEHLIQVKVWESEKTCAVFCRG